MALPQTQESLYQADHLKIIGEDFESVLAAFC